MLATRNDPVVASAANIKTVDTKNATTTTASDADSAADSAASDKSALTQDTIAKGDSSSLSTLTAASKKLADSEKKKDFLSRPVSTISGNSMTSVDDSQECTGKQMDNSQDSLSAMPTPRNTFLCPPTDINIIEGESVQAPSRPAAMTSPTASEWSDEKHQKQLQILLEKKGVPRDNHAQKLRRESDGTVDKSASSTADAAAAASASASFSSAEEYTQRQIPSVPSYDDSYCLLAQSALIPGYSPASREAAIAQLRRLAGTETRTNNRRHASKTDLHLPPLLAPPVDALCQLEEALMGVLTRRNVPNRALVYCSRKGSGAASAASTSGATSLGSAASVHSSSAAGKAARRKQRMSMMPAGQDASGGADDKRSNRSRVSVMSGEIVSSLTLGATPYTELNAHMERLTACISKLQTLPADMDAKKPSEGSVSRPATSKSSSAAHRRQSSISSVGAKSFVSAHSATGAMTISEDTPPPMPAQPDATQLRSPSHTRLPPVNENHTMEDISAAAAADDSIRPRSSSHASIVSGASSESRRRIVVNEIPRSSQYPNLFGLPVIPAANSSQTPAKTQSNQPAPSI
ncbi:hypothetical protein J3B02_004709, partial [Coemansia erecta]